MLIRTSPTLPGSIVDNGRGQADDVPMECHIRFSIPHNRDRIVELQVADLRFVEVGVHLELGEVSQLQHLRAGLDIGIPRHRE